MDAIAPKQQHYVVVYQFGKVASTSLAASLNALPDVEAVQSHFLGEKSLSEMVKIVVDPKLGPYFHDHQAGQFMRNVNITYRVNQFKAGAEGNLVLLSMARRPIDWFRSSLSQDIQGYLPLLRDVAVQHDLSCENDAVLCLQALPHVLRRMADMLSHFESLDTLVDNLPAAERQITTSLGQGMLRQVFYMMLRPHNWYRGHFQSAFGVPLEAFQKEGPVYHCAGKWFTAYVFRYEDLNRAMGHIVDALGIGADFHLRQENQSVKKSLSAEIKQVFLGPEAAALDLKFRTSAYSRFFGYES